jgi:uncharacterized protein YyaL (SSP411 family)
MAVAARALGRSDFAESATRAVDFIREHLFRDGRLLAVHKDGQSRFAAYLDDYAFLLDALLELLQTRWRSSDLQLGHCARRRSAPALRRYRERRLLLHGRRSRATDPSLEVVRRRGSACGQRDRSTGADAPRLLLGETRYLDASARTLRAAWAPLQHYPHAHASMLVALAEHLDPPRNR